MQQCIESEAGALVPGVVLVGDESPEYIYDISLSKDYIVLKLRMVNDYDKVRSLKLDAHATVRFIPTEERVLEFLYIDDNNDLCFFDPKDLIDWYVDMVIVEDRKWLLKTGVEVKGIVFDNKLIDIVLAGFIDYMVMDIETTVDPNSGKTIRLAILETGGKVEVPDNVELSDIIKVDTGLKRFLQRV